MQSHWDDIQIKVAGTGIVRASADVGGSAGIIRPVRPLRSPVDLSFISCARLGDDWTAGSYHRRDWTGGKHPTDQKLHLQLFVYRPIAASLRKSPKSYLLLSLFYLVKYLLNYLLIMPFITICYRPIQYCKKLTVGDGHVTTCSTNRSYLSA